MPTRIRDSSPERKKDEKKHSRIERDRSTKTDRRYKSSSHRTSSLKDKTSSRTSLSPSDSKRRTSAPAIDENDEKNSESRANLPYPSFSKAHSKESVGSHPSLNIFTPPATDVDADKTRPASHKLHDLANGPPSPPLTDRNAGRPRTASSRGAPVESIPEEDRKEGKEEKYLTTLRTKPSRSDGHLRSSSDTGSTSPTKPVHRSSTPLKRVQGASNAVPQRSVSQPTRAASPAPLSEVATEVATNHSSSNATSIAPQQPTIQRPGSQASKPIANHSISSATKILAEPVLSRQQTPLDVFINSPASQNSAAYPGPPPPPPPPNVPLVVPRVDYLLQHGGLNRPATKNLLYAGKPMAVQQAAAIPNQPAIVVANLFEPYNTLLGDFEKVIAKNGSLAVATGYRSVARRLLDRLEKVFSRDISSEECSCCMCATEIHLEDSRGVSWGEILELVSGRRDLPNWPPFAFVASPSGLGISLDMQAPMQKVDIDVPEEYREHYIRQSRKTKQSVDKWLSRQADDPSSPPEEVDDETLTFAILTHLGAEQRQHFKDFLGIIDKPLEPPKRSSTPEANVPHKPPPTPMPQPRPRSQCVITAAQAIQRLYRLASMPRDPETALFLLNNAAMHNALATLAAISDDEWDILISGRFDGFLRSGAEDVPDVQNGRHVPSRGSQRDFSSSHNGILPRQTKGALRQPTPTTVNPQHGAPIALDEETEISTLAEIERDIYTGMEQLEDAFEALHQRAEAVRRALRERSTGLAAAAQRRRGPSASTIEVRMGTPASGIGLNWDTETDDGLGDWDGVSEIAPDDSASNISSARRRRPKRRTERRTPAMIDEEDEGDDSYADESERSRSPKKR